MWSGRLLFGWFYNHFGRCISNIFSSLKILEDKVLLWVYFSTDLQSDLHELGAHEGIIKLLAREKWGYSGRFHGKCRMGSYRSQGVQWNSNLHLYTRWAISSYWFFFEAKAHLNLLCLQYHNPSPDIDVVIVPGICDALRNRRESRAASHHSAFLLRHAARHGGHHTKGWQDYTIDK